MPNGGKPTTGRPLWQGPIIGALYLLAGVGLGLAASAVGGWPAIPLWILAIVLALAGAWTALFTGLWLTLASVAKRVSKSNPE
jgi:hypothetical protein